MDGDEENVTTAAFQKRSEPLPCEVDLRINFDDFNLRSPSKDNQSPQLEHPGRRHLDAFHLVRVIGKGGFGTVYQVKHRPSGGVYAMKVIRKDRLQSDSDKKQAFVERNVLALFAAEAEDDPLFIVRLHCAFQTTQRIYLVMDFVNGGELFFHMRREQLLSEAHIILALEFLHTKGILHRDLKPENVLLDREGHVVMTDFGLAKENLEGKTHSWCGTEEYMAPEVILREGYDEAADWWSLGALLYDMMVGEPPFMGARNEGRGKLHERIVKAKFKLPTFLTYEASSLLKGLMTRDTSKRLRTAKDVKQHKFFQNFSFKKLKRRELAPPYVPNVGSQPLSPSNTTFFEASLADHAISPNIPSPPELYLDGETDAQMECFKGFSFIAPGIAERVFTHFEYLREQRTSSATEDEPTECAADVEEFNAEAANAVEIYESVDSDFIPAISSDAGFR